MEACADPKSLEGLIWWACYLTNGKHIAFYFSFLIVIAVILIVAPVALGLGFLGAVARRSSLMVVRLFGLIYTNMVRGVPEVIFFLFIPFALDQGIEIIRHYSFCPDVTEPIYRGNDFVVCDIAKAPLLTADPWVHSVYGFGLAVIAFALIFGAYAANTLFGAMNAVPQAAIETAKAYALTDRQIFWRILLPQMWVYALPGLSNIFMILVKATPLLFLLGVPDIVYWARELGGTKTQIFAYPHPDWRLWYFMALLVFYLFVTHVSDLFFTYIRKRISYQFGIDETSLASEGGRT